MRMLLVLYLLFSLLEVVMDLMWLVSDQQLQRTRGTVAFAVAFNVFLAILTVAVLLSDR